MSWEIFLIHLSEINNEAVQKFEETMAPEWSPCSKTPVKRLRLQVKHRILLLSELIIDGVFCVPESLLIGDQSTQLS